MKSLVILALVTVAWGTPVKRRNPMENEGLFEGDIMGIDPYADRNAVPRDSQRWPNAVIPYEVDPSLYGMWDMLMKAMRHIEEQTCIRFKQRKQEKDYVTMYKGTGCWSFWGRLGNGEQKLSLGSGCDYFGTVVHELLHAMGFEHEHNRSDRDEYLNINWQNIDSKWSYAFTKLHSNENRLLTSFDYDSIMLYGQYSFSKGNGLKSMEAKNGRFLDEPYNKKGLSSSDVERINILYGCQI